ncbi:MAG: hypothetical protein IIV61_04430 [Oscillospiraceae bacterium]|nr:hypothetical protein [Oscillospiraceae bacterium]
MREAEIKKYAKLNELAEQGGIVIFGCNEDKDIPTGEIRQAFAVGSKIYNRSFDDLSVTESVSIYEKMIAPLAPETVLIHIGEADLTNFAGDPTAFDNQYLELLKAIKARNKKYRIAVVSLKNYENDPQIAEMNKHLKYIADSEQCEYGDISAKKVWDPKASMDAASFVYSIGFVHPLKNKRPLYDLVKMLFCYEA